MSEKSPIAELTIVHDPEDVEGFHRRLTNMAVAAISERELADGSEPWIQNNFRALFHGLVNHIDATADPRSIALSWLSTPLNRVQFRQVIPAAECLSFFEEHLDNPFITHMLDDPRVLELLPDTDQSNFVTHVLATWIPDGDAWMRALVETNVSTTVVAEAMLHWLRNQELFDESKAFMARFLREGAGQAIRIPRGHGHGHVLYPGWRLPTYRTLWWALSDDQLAEALHICATLDPNGFFEAPANDDIPVSRKVQLRLDADTAKSILEKAAHNLQSSDGLSVEGLGCLRYAVKRVLARRLNGISLPFLVMLALDREDGYEVLTEHVRKVIKLGDFVTNFLAAYQIMHTFQEQENLPEWRRLVLVRLGDILPFEATQNGAATGELNVVTCGVLGVRLSSYVVYTDPAAHDGGLRTGDRVIFRIPAKGTTVTFYGF